MDYNNYNNNYQQQQYQPRDAHAQGSDRALGWDDEITQDSAELILAEPGIYQFTVKSFTRGRFDGSAKMTACPEAILAIEIIDKATGRPVTITERLRLHTKMEWRLSEFFVSIGQKRKGESCRPNWTAVTGAKGLLELNHRKSGDKTYNNINHFLEPQQSQQVNYSSGQF